MEPGMKSTLKKFFNTLDGIVKYEKVFWYYDITDIADIT